MAKTQFTFWNNKEDTGMKEHKTMYTSEIDKQAQNGGDPANGRLV